ncbi:hypothetical protein [Streptacidiphilus sp. EB129]|uniref:hypothetical protein n=1 Tax=Streptacidiphilus sp. EB129 TaxID=3156262 RepID=UPI003515838D
MDDVDDGTEGRAAAGDGSARSAFLAALGVDAGREQVDILQQELEWFAHPRARVAARRQEPVDTLVEFLATTRLAVPGGAAQGFRSRLADAIRAATEPGLDRSPRETVIACVPDLFGHAPETLAARLEALVTLCGSEQRPLDSRTLRRLYAEASDLCDVWVLALREGLNTASDPVGMADELYATEGAVLSVFEPADAGVRRLELADLVRQLTELVALDRWGLLPRRDWPSAELPSLGWPSVLIQAQYRLRQVAAAGPSAAVESAAPESAALEPAALESATAADGSGGPPAAAGLQGDRRYGQARHLLAAYGADERRSAPTRGRPGIGDQRIRRSHREVMFWATRLQLADLAWALRRQPEPMAAYRLGRDDDAEATADTLVVLLSDPPSVQPVPGPDRLPLDSWELRELFPELCRLLGLYRVLLTQPEGDPYREANDPSVLPDLAAAAYVDSCGGSGRVAAELSAEIAAFDLLFTGDAEADRAVALLGEQPRGADPQVPWWDDLTWRAWLRDAAADVLWRARPGTAPNGGPR